MDGVCKKMERYLFPKPQKLEMARILFLILIIAGTTLSQAQAYPPFGPDRELKLNAGLFMATGAVEGSYEYFIGEDLSIGGTAYWDNDPYDYNGNFGIGPNLRAYFGYVPRSGFFAEAFGLYFKGRETDLRVDPEPDYRYTSVALGLGAGSKWTTRSQRFSLEVYGGIGRTLNPEDFQDDFIYRAGLNIGFRF